MSKHFTDVKYDGGEDVSFAIHAVPVFISNSLRRAIMNEVPTFTIDPETTRYTVNTSPWDPDAITHAIAFVPMKIYTLAKHDINMLELFLVAENTTEYYRYVFASELQVRNKETSEFLQNEDVVLYPDSPLFTMGPGQRVEMTASLEKLTKVDVAGRQMAARHQAGTVGYSYEEGKEEETTVFKASLYIGLNPQQHISLAFDSMIQHLREIQVAIRQSKQEKFYIQLNRDGRYDFVILGESHTMGNMIASWINRHETKSVAGYHTTRDRKAITIDYGLFRFAPPLLRQSERTQDLEDLVNQSLRSLEPQVERQQRDVTIQTFLEHLRRLEGYISDLQKDWNRIKL